MRCTEILKARVSPELKRRAKALANREHLTEAAWLKRLVIREMHAFGENGAPMTTASVYKPSAAVQRSSETTRRVYVRLCLDDWLLLDARAAARGMRPATYLSVLMRSHLRSLAPLPKAELLILKRSISELAAIGRNINQIAHAANGGPLLPHSVSVEFRAMLRICEALRDSTKSVAQGESDELERWVLGSQR